MFIKFFILKDSSLVISKIKYEGDSMYILEDPIRITVAPTPSGSSGVNLISTSYPHPLIGMFVIEGEAKESKLFEDMILKTYSEDVLKKELITWYLQSISPIDLVSSIPKNLPNNVLEFNPKK